MVSRSQPSRLKALLRDDRGRQCHHSDADDGVFGEILTTQNASQITLHATCPKGTRRAAVRPGE
jgi:hypothetical protein